DLALQLLTAKVVEGEFEFANRLRWVYKLQCLEELAGTILERAKSLPSVESRMWLKFRADVLAVRLELRRQLKGVIKPGEEEARLFVTGTLDEMMFQLLDPEAVLEEEEMMGIRRVRRTSEAVMRSPETPTLDGAVAYQSARPMRLAV